MNHEQKSDQGYDPKRKYVVNRISKSFGTGQKEGSIEVVRDFSINIAEMESIVMLGPSGCGKSTLLKILGGVLPATEGELSLDGVNYGKELPKSVLRKFGFVFQTDNLLQWRTVEGNLRFMLETMHLKGKEWDERVDEMLNIVGLLKYKSFYPHELSGGMKQRVGIARALVHAPEVLVFDQPFGALDAITRKMLAFELLRIWRKTETTLVMVTNNVDEAVLLAERVLLFSKLPATIVKETRVDIPLDQRTGNILQDAQFIETCKVITEAIRSIG
jgi:NitT/TauT family transport system ATP-binding protein